MFLVLLLCTSIPSQFLVALDPPKLFIRFGVPEWLITAQGLTFPDRELFRQTLFLLFVFF